MIHSDRICSKYDELPKMIGLSKKKFNDLVKYGYIHLKYRDVGEDKYKLVDFNFIKRIQNGFTYLGDFKIA